MRNLSAEHKYFNVKSNVMRHLQLFLFFIFPVMVLGQANIVNKSLVDTTKHELYKWCDNTIIISGVKTDKKIRIKVNKADVKHQTNAIFIVRPFQEGFDTLRVFANNKLVYIWPYIIDTIPDPIVRIADHIDTLLTIQQILLSPFLSVHFPKTNWDHRWRVYGFNSVISQISEGNEFVESSPSSCFTGKQVKIFRQLKKGDKIVFEDIRGGGPDSRMVKLPTFTVLIK